MHTTIIAEAGVNHNGSMTLAKQMVEKAKQAGADYVKFQTFVPEKLVSRFAQKAEYQKETTGAAESQLQMLQKLALTQEDFIELQAYCKTVGIGFLSTPFDLDSIAFLEKLDAAKVDLVVLAGFLEASFRRNHKFAISGSNRPHRKRYCYVYRHV